MVAAAVVGSAVVGIGSGVMQSHAASSASRQQANAANQATQAQQQMFQQTQQNLQPFINTGKDAGTKLSQLEGLNGGSPESIQASLQSLPGYQFALQQGLKSTQNSAAARGLGTSGAALRGAAEYSTGLANQQYNNLLSGVQQTFNTGENAAAGFGSDATATGQGIAGTIQNQGNAQAAGTLGSANALSGGLNGLQNAFYASKILGGDNSNSGVYGNAYTPAPGLNQAGISNGFDLSGG